MADGISVSILSKLVKGFPGYRPKGSK